MHHVEPTVFLVGETHVTSGLAAYLQHVGAPEWVTDAPSEGERLIEAMGRLCYRSWRAGMNANVTKKRDGNDAYLAHIIEVGHGSVLEHATSNWIFADVSRVFTHELVRHRAGTAFCVDGDTEVTIQTMGSARDRATLNRVKIKDLYQRINIGAKDKRGRVRLLPSSLGRTVRVLNEETQTFQAAKIVNVFKTGKRRTIRITVGPRGRRRDKNEIICTPEHHVYTSTGWKEAGDLCVYDLVAVSGKRNIAPPSNGFTPRLRSAIAVWTTAQRERLVKYPADVCYKCLKPYPHNELELDHVIPVIKDLARALDVGNLAPICSLCHIEKTGGEQTSKLVVAGSVFKPITSIEPAGNRETYDLEVEGPWNNYLGNGIVVHNSQESLRYVRLEDLGLWLPPEVRANPEATAIFERVFRDLEAVQLQLAEMLQLDALSMDAKKKLTSAMRRVAPIGLATTIGFSMNARTLRHLLLMRTARTAEVEMRIVFDEVGRIACAAWPNIVADFKRTEVDGIGEWTTPNIKV